MFRAFRSFRVEGLGPGFVLVFSHGSAGLRLLLCTSCDAFSRLEAFRVQVSWFTVVSLCPALLQEFKGLGIKCLGCKCLRFWDRIPVQDLGIRVLGFRVGPKH